MSKQEKHNRRWKYIVFSVIGLSILILLLREAPLNEKVKQKIHEKARQVEETTGRDYEPAKQYVADEIEEVFMPCVMEYYLGVQTKAITEEAMLEFNQQWSREEEDFADEDLVYDCYDSHLEEHAVQVVGMYHDMYDVLEVLDEKRNWSALLDVMDMDMPEGGFRPTFYFEWIGKANMKADNPDVIREAFRENDNVRLEIAEQMNYITENLTENDYAGVDYDVAKKQLIVYLVNEELREMLEDKGFVCEDVEYSYAQLYQRMHEIWEVHQELGIATVSVSEENNCVYIEGILPEKEFVEKIAQYTWSEQPYVYCNVQYPIATGSVTGLIDVEDVDEFIEILKEKNLGDNVTYYKRLEAALLFMKDCYPDYTLLQLYYHVSVDCDYQNYMNFDDELEEFVSSLPAYKKDMDFIKELSYGDSLRLGLKQVLRQAKELYPVKSYQELYELYPELRELVETTNYSKSESMHRYMYLKAMQKKALYEDVEIQEPKGNIGVFVIGGLVLGMIIIVCIIVKCKRERKYWDNCKG